MDDPFEGSSVSGDVRYKVVGKELWVEIPLVNAIDEMGVLTAYIFGYRPGFLFADMPKLALKLFGNKMFAYDGSRTFHDPSLVYRLEKERLLMRVPLKLLKEPKGFFVSTRNAKEAMSLDFGAWKQLEIAS